MRTPWPLALAALALPAAAQEVPVRPVRNGGFEVGEPGVHPLGWREFGDNAIHGYAARVVANAPFEGDTCAELVYEGAGNPVAWGWLHQSLPARPFHGKWVRFVSAVSVRSEERGNFGSQAGLYVEAFGPNDASHGRDTMEGRRIVARTWNEYELYIAVPEDAEWLNVGYTFYGPGAMACDAARLEILGDASEPLPEAAGPWNLDFTTGDPGELPWAWQVSDFLPDSEYRAFLPPNPDQREDGVALSFTTDPDFRTEGWFQQTFDAEPYRAQLVGLTAKIAVEADEPPGGAVQMWIAFNAEDGSRLSFEQQRSPVRAPQRVEARVEAFVPPEADSIQIGLTLMGTARARWDDLAFESLGEAVVLAEPPRPLVGRALENLVAFAKLLGYVRHFHPSDQAEATDWDSFAIRGVQAVEGAADDAELAARLAELFRPVAPTVRVFVEGDEPELDPALLEVPDARRPRVSVWRHRGFGHGGPVYWSRRATRRVRDGVLPENVADPAAPFRAALGGGVACLVPLTVYEDTEGTFPHVEAPAADPLLLPSGADRATRLAVAILAWNVFQHFYPYFDVVGTDWPAVLETSLRRAATDADAQAFLATLRRMGAALRDGHVWVGHESEVGRPGLPIVWDWVEGRVVAVAVGEGAVATDGGRVPRRGDVLLALDGRPVEEVLAEDEEQISGAHEAYVRRRALGALTVRGDPRHELRLLSAAGEEYVTTMETFPLVQPVVEPRPEPVAEIEPGIVYVDIARIDEEDFAEALPALEAAGGIVIDFRGYPQLNPVFLAHLIDGPAECPIFLFPEPARPDREATEFERSSWDVEPEEPLLTAPVAFVIDERAISYAETCMGIVEAYGLGQIVGRPTAGTNGNVNPFELPGGYRFVWTGMKVLKHDGSTLHGVGILPTVPVERTLAGVAAGRDELLEAAVAVVRGDLEGLDADREGFLHVTSSRAERLVGTGALDEALAALDRGLALDPGHELSLYWRGFVLWARGEEEAAARDFDRLVERVPDQFWAYQNRAHAAYAARRFSDALEDFGRMRELAPELDEQHVYTWLCRARLGEREAAGAELRPLLPEDVEESTWDLTARFLLGDLPEDEYLSLIAGGSEGDEPIDCLAWFYAAAKHLLDGDEAGARERFRRCVDTGVTGLHEAWTARRELERLGDG